MTQGQGTISSEPLGHGDNSRGSYQYENTPITLTATPDEGWVLDHWEEVLGVGRTQTVGSKETFTFRARADRSLRAVFARERFTLTTHARGDDGYVQRTFPGKPAYTYPATSVVRLDPCAGYGSVFSHWEGDYDPWPEDAGALLLSMDRDRDVTAVFRPTLDVDSVVFDGTERPLKEVLWVDEPLEFTVHFHPALPENHTLADVIPDPLTIKVRTATTEHALDYGESGVSYALADKRRSIKVTVTGAARDAWNLVPSNEDDNVRQYCSVEAPSSTNWYDSDAFDDMMAKHGSTVWSDETAGPWVQDEAMRLRAPKLGLIQSWINVAHWTAADVKRYLIAGGATTLTAAAAGQNEIERSAQRLVADQADCLYVSAHGSHSTGNIILRNQRLLPTVTLSPGDVQWNQGLTHVFFALCSVLDVLGEHPPSPSTDKPGINWATSGPDEFFGYRAWAPGDALRCPDNYVYEYFTARIIRHFAIVHDSEAALAWGVTNRHHAASNLGCWHACVIDAKSRVFHWFTVVDKNNGNVIYEEPGLTYREVNDAIDWKSDNM